MSYHLAFIYIYIYICVYIYIYIYIYIAYLLQQQHNSTIITFMLLIKKRTKTFLKVIILSLYN